MMWKLVDVLITFCFISIISLPLSLIIYIALIYFKFIP
jgi:hypothetical protein